MPRYEFPWDMKLSLTLAFIRLGLRSRALVLRWFGRLPRRLRHSGPGPELCRVAAGLLVVRRGGSHVLSRVLGY
jgi:hypothetical protein